MKISSFSRCPYDYPSIASTNEVEEAARFAQYATGFTGLVQAAIVTEDIALREMQARGVLTTVTPDDIETAQQLNREGDEEIWNSSNSWSGSLRADAPEGVN